MLYVRKVWFRSEGTRTAVEQHFRPRWYGVQGSLESLECFLVGDRGWPQASYLFLAMLELMKIV